MQQQQQQQHSCGNGTCCSPSKLWRQLQNIIRTGNEQAFSELCGDEDRARHVARVLFRQRLDNDPSMYPASHKHRVLQLEDITYDQKLQFKHYFGTSVKDLNGLQLALFFKKESFAKKLLNFLYHHQEQQQSSNEFQSFINHTWGNKNTSLHLACFLGMPSLVALLLKLGAHSNPINLKNYGPLDGCTNNQCIQLIKKNKKNNLSPIKTTKTATIQKQQSSSSSLEFKPLSIHLYPQQQLQPQKDLAQTSMLLKKAVQQVSELPMDHLLSSNLTTTTAKPSLVFSSSTSSSSSFSSISSLDDQQQQQQQQRQQLPSLPPSPLTPTTPDLILDDGYSFHCWSPPLTPPPSSSMKSFNINNTTSSLPQPDPSYYRTIRPPMPLKSPPPPPSPTSFQEEEEEEEDNGEDEQIQVQNVDNDDSAYQDQKEKESIIISSSPKLTSILKDPTTTALKKNKRVSFQPDILMVDICKQGNVNDLIHLIKDHLNNDDDEDSDFSLSSSLFLKWQQDYFSKEGTMKTLPSMLHLAVLHNNEKMVHFLIYKLIGINVNALDQEGFTPLHYAATLGLWKLVHLLAHHPKIVLNLKTKNGLTIYDCPRTLFDKRKCKNVLDHAKKLHLQQQQSV